MRRSLAALMLVFDLLAVSCSSAAAPTPQIIYVTAAPSLAPVMPSSTPTTTSAPTPLPTPTPILSSTPSAMSCGRATTPDVMADVAAGAAPLDFTKQAFLDTWNGWWLDADMALNRVKSLGPLGETGGFQTYAGMIPVTNQEDMLVVLVAPNGKVQAVVLSIQPDIKQTNPLGNSPLSSGLFMDTFAGIFSPEGTGLLNQLGVFLPVVSYDALDRVNTCLEFGSNYMRLVDVPAIGTHTRSVYLFVRSARV